MFYFNYPAVTLTILGSIAPSGAVERQRFPLWVVVWFYYSGPKLTVLKKCLTYLWIFTALNLANGFRCCILDNEEFYDSFYNLF